MKLTAMPVLLVAAALAAVPDGADERKEPPERFTLQVGGKTVPIEVDKPLDIETTSPSTRVTLRVEPHRVFDLAGLRFHYPREMGFKPNLGTPNLRMWTLKTNSAVFMVERFEGRPDFETVRRGSMDTVVATYGSANVKREESSLTLGKRELTGTTLHCVIAGTRILQSFYSFKAGNDTVVLMLQDTPGKDGAHSEEFDRALGMFRETFQFPRDAE